MNKKEHQLMIMMLARQAEVISTLIEIMKSRGVMEDGDFLPFEAWVQSGPSNVKLFGQVWEQYRAYASALGLETQLAARPGDTAHKPSRKQDPPQDL